jgi:hypothetical protein
MIARASRGKAKRRPGGPTQTTADRYAKGERPVMVWLGAGHMATLENLCGAYGFNFRQAIEYLLENVRA